MASISFSGLGSGIDFNAVRDAIINQRAQPINQIQAKVNNYGSRVEALKSFNALLASLTSATQSLTNREVGTGRSSTSTDDSIVTAAASSSANIANLSVNVTRTATHLTQASRTYAAASAPVLANDADEATFELRKGDGSAGITITIDSTNNTLSGLRDSINAKGAGVTATIVDVTGDGSQQKLVLTSNATGASGRVELVETSNTGTGTDLDLGSLNPPDEDFTKLDAAFSVNGLNITRSTNNISDAIAGVTLTLKKTGSASIGVIQSTDIEDKLKEFVTAYNAVQDFVAGQYKKDAKDRPSGILAGDSTLRNVQQQLRVISNTAAENNGGSFNSLSQIGVKTTDDGHLELDSALLGDKLKNNYEDVRSLIVGKTAGQTGVFQSSYTVSSSLSDNITGSVQTAINGFQSSVKSLNNTIANRSEALNRLRDSLTRQFAAADAAIGQLNGQSTSLSNLIKSLSGSNNN